MKNLAPTIKHLGAGVTDYVERSGVHHATAKTLGKTTGTETHYKSAQELRLAAHEYDLAQFCLELAQQCTVKMHRAMFSEYRRKCLVAEKNRRHNAPGTLATNTATPKCERSLAEVAALFSNWSAPPGTTTPELLTSVQQSNAPNGVHLRNFPTFAIDEPRRTKT